MVLDDIDPGHLCCESTVDTKSRAAVASSTTAACHVDDHVDDSSDEGQAQKMLCTISLTLFLVCLTAFLWYLCFEYFLNAIPGYEWYMKALLCAALNLLDQYV